MIHLLPTDIETRSTVNLKKTGAHIYAAHPSTEVLCVGYCADDGPVKIWRRGEPPPQEFSTAASDPNWRIVAHNAAFERLIIEHKLAPDHGFPIIPLERTICTMAMAHAAALPGALEQLARVCGFTHQKDMVGELIMQQMTKPRRALKNEDNHRIHFYDDDERRRRLEEYCILDVNATREASERLPWLSEEEHTVWLLDQRINNYGFYLDNKLGHGARKIALAMKPQINTELAKITDGAVTSFTEVAKLTKWLRQFIEIDSLGKVTIETLFEQDLPEKVRRVLELRLLGAQAAVAKVDALMQRQHSDGRVRGSFIYHAAGPGRWSSRGAQVHNLKRPLTEDLIKAVKIISSGDAKLAQRNYDNPLSVIGDCVRSMIVAAPGHVLIGGDFSGIEARVTAWIAGEERKLDVFRKYDAGEGPDPYIVAASIIFGIPVEQVTKGQRQIGKGAELAFGFQGGVNAYKRFLPSGGISATQSQSLWQKRHGSGRSGGESKVSDTGIVFNDAEIEKIMRKWRRAHPHIEQFWGDSERAAGLAVRNPNSIVSLGNKLQFTCDEQPFMWLTLPSGRQLAYPNMRATRAFIFEGAVVEHENGYRCLLFKDAANKRWRDVKVYGGLLCLGASTEVLSLSGWKRIIDVTDADLIWDGVEWVHHQGLVARGVKETITLDGVRMTTDHKVLTEHGWIRAAQAEGLHRAKVRLPDNTRGCWVDWTKTQMESAVHLWKDSRSSLERAYARALLRLHVGQPDQQSAHNARYEPTSSVLCLALNAGSLSTTDPSSLEKLRWAGHPSMPTLAAVREFLGGYGANVSTWSDTRTQEQRQGIQSEQLLLGDVLHASKQSTSEATFDLVNCGPRRRFVVRGTASPLIVHNCENIVQATARDLLAQAMLRIDAHGYKIVTHVHDEIVIEVPQAQAETAKAEFTELMMQVPEWAEGLPIRVSAWVNERYVK